MIQGISIFYSNYKCSVTFKKFESLYCTPVTLTLYINYTLILKKVSEYKPRLRYQYLHRGQRASLMPCGS